MFPASSIAVKIVGISRWTKALMNRGDEIGLQLHEVSSCLDQGLGGAQGVVWEKENFWLEVCLSS